MYVSLFEKPDLCGCACLQIENDALQVRAGDNVVMLPFADNDTDAIDELRGQTELQQETLQEILNAQKKLKLLENRVRRTIMAERA